MLDCADSRKTSLKRTVLWMKSPLKTAAGYDVVNAIFVAQATNFMRIVQEPQQAWNEFRCLA